MAAEYDALETKDMLEEAELQDYLETSDAIDQIESDDEMVKVEYLCEPTEDVLLDALLPMSLKIFFYRALLESAASEHGARMTAMESASGNAGDMIEKLSIKYNRARQAAITTELMEVVSGAEALKG